MRRVNKASAPRIEKVKNTRIKNIKDRIKEIEAKVKEYEKLENIDWGHIGDLGMIEDSLGDIADTFTE